MYILVNHAHLYNWIPLPCYLTTAVLNDHYSEAMAYTVLAYSYLASLHDPYESLGHTHQRYWL